MKKIVLHAAPFLTALIMGALCFFIINENSLLLACVGALLVCFILWLVLFVSRLFKRFSDKLIIHTVVLIFFVLASLSVPLIINYVQNTKNIMDPIRTFEGSHVILESCTLNPYSNVVCSIDNTTPYQFDMVKLKIGILDTKSKKVWDHKTVVISDIIEPHSTKRISGAVSFNNLPKDYEWIIDNEMYQVSKESFKKNLDGMLPYERKGLSGKWFYYYYGDKICEVLAIEDTGEIKQPILFSKNCAIDKGSNIITCKDDLSKVNDSRVEVVYNEKQKIEKIFVHFINKNPKSAFDKIPVLPMVLYPRLAGCIIGADVRIN